LEGIDVSKHQGSIDFKAVQAAGKEFVIVCGGDGAYSNPLFEEQVKGASDCYLHVEVYHFLRFNLSPAEMAGICDETYDLALLYGMKPPGRLWLDMEDIDTCQDWTAEQRIEWLWEVIRLLTGMSIPLGIYTGGWYWQSRMGDTDAFAHLPLWTSGYPFVGINSFAEVGGLSPELYGGWTECLIWQYHNKGQVPGIDADVDLNWAYKSWTEGSDEGMPLDYNELNSMLLQMQQDEYSVIGGFWRNIVTLAKAANDEGLSDQEKAEVRELLGKIRLTVD